MGFFDLGDTLSSDNHDSPIGKLAKPIQKWTDPLSWITGGKWADWTSTDLPRMTNQVLAPVAQFNGKIDKKINPLRRIGAVDNVMDTVEAKPGDAIGLAIGSYFAAPALGAAAGGGGAGGAGTAAGSSVGGSAALGDAGATGLVSAGGSGLSGATAGEMGGALGSSPTGLFSGLLPGGGMSGTSSGALGGGLSGEVAGASSIGGASMGGGGGLLDLSNLSSQLNQAGNMAKQNDQQQQGRGSPHTGGSPHTPSLSIQQIAAMYGLPAGLLASNLV